MCELTMREAGYTPAEIREIEQHREEAEMAQLREIMDSDDAPFMDKLDAMGRAGELVVRAGHRLAEAMREAQS
ncbi:MAG TPA: hypothetical protein VFW94_03685 [Candidatus Acidoferrales bacterium]|nr:hypothetical protein [Candidatus Acidoferrales bacterium]